MSVIHEMPGRRQYELERRELADEQARTVLCEQARTVLCPNCEAGRHELPCEFCCCACHTITLGSTLDAERVSDARQDLNDWLNYSVGDTKNLLVSLLRVHAAACKSAPVAAMVLLPMIEEVQRVEQGLAELQAVSR